MSQHERATVDTKPWMMGDRKVSFTTLMALHGLRRQEHRENACLDRIDYLEARVQTLEDAIRAHREACHPAKGESYDVKLWNLIDQGRG